MNLQIAIIVVLVIGFSAMLYLQYSRSKGAQGQDLLLEWLKEMRGTTESLEKRFDERMGETYKELADTKKTLYEQLNQTNKSLNETLRETNKTMNERLDNAAKVIGGISKELGEMSELGKDMKKVQEFLASPKRRGGLGEEVLNSILEQYFPSGQYDLQYRFSDGNTVDAAIRISGRIVPVDAKFSMENYRKFVNSETEEERKQAKKDFVNDIRKRVREIHKYINPKENTVDYAVMYIPSEAVFYEITNDDDLAEYAREHKILLTSPNSFVNYLRTIMFALKEQKINEVASEILRYITAIKQDSDKFAKNLDVLSRHVTNAKNSSDNLNSDFAQLQNKIERVSSLKLDNPDKSKELLED